jgi:hypothetical protein
MMLFSFLLVMTLGFQFTFNIMYVLTVSDLSDINLNLCLMAYCKFHKLNVIRNPNKIEHNLIIHTPGGCHLQDCF